MKTNRNSRIKIWMVLIVALMTLNVSKQVNAQINSKQNNGRHVTHSEDMGNSIGKLDAAIKLSDPEEAKRLLAIQHEEINVENYINSKLSGIFPVSILNQFTTKLDQEMTEHPGLATTPYNELIDNFKRAYLREQYFIEFPSSKTLYDGKPVVGDKKSRSANACPVQNFETGSFGSSFSGYTGFWSGVVGMGLSSECELIPVTGVGTVAWTPSALPASPDFAIVSGSDAYGPKTSNGSNFAVRINSTTTGGRVSRLRTTFTSSVSGSQSASFAYSLVMENPSFHNLNQPFFVARILDNNGNELDRICNVSSVSNPFFTSYPDPYDPSSFLLASTWQCASLNYTAVTGQNYTIEFDIADCGAGGHFGYAYIDDICVSCGSGGSGNSGSIALNPTDTCQKTMTVTGVLTPPSIGTNTGVLTALNYQILHNGLPIGPAVAVTPLPLTNFSFNITPASFGTSTGGFDFRVNATYSLSGGSVTITETHTNPGQNNDYSTIPCCNLISDPPKASLRIGTCDSCPNVKVTVAGGMVLDKTDLNNGDLSNSLKFGSCISGEAIASKRTASGNQWGLDFYTNYLNRMAIANNGYVGINTTNPQGRLHISPASGTEHAIHIDNNSGYEIYGAGSNENTNIFSEGDLYLLAGATKSLRFGSNNSNSKMILDPNGNVGIGINPLHKFHVHDGLIMVSGANSSGGPMIVFSDDITTRPNGRWGIEYEPNVHGLNFWQPWNPGVGGGGNFYMFLKDDGNIGINNSNPGNRFEITKGTPDQSGLRFTNLTSSSNTVTPVTSNVLSVNADGDVILVPPCCSNTNNNYWSRNTTTGTIYPTNTTSLGDKLALGTNSVLTTNPNLYPGGFNARLKLNGGDLVIQEDSINNVGSPDQGADVYLIDKNGNGLDIGAQDGNAELIAFGANTSLKFSTPGAPQGIIMHGDGTNKGKVQIGNVTTPGNYRLYVEKGILTEKVKVAVKTSAQWADHVLSAQYNLMPLNDVEKYIQSNSHLPGIPAAKELVNDGLDLGDMQAKQMAKIEELTLYLIEIKNRLDELQKENEVLRSTHKN